MQKSVWVLLIALGSLFAVSSWAVCPEEPLDDGECDTLHAEVYPGDEILDGQLVRVPLYVTNDIAGPSFDSIYGFAVPLCFTSSNPNAHCSLSYHWNNVNLYPAPDLDRSIFRHLPGQTNIMMSYAEDSTAAEWKQMILDLDGTSHFWLSMCP
jgi:hypothetical protein